MNGKNGGGHFDAGLKLVEVNAGFDVVFAEEANHVFGGHIAGQFVFGHGAAAKAANGAVEPGTAVFPGRLNFFAPGGGGGM